MKGVEVGRQQRCRRCRCIWQAMRAAAQALAIDHQAEGRRRGSTVHSVTHTRETSRQLRGRPPQPSSSRHHAQAPVNSLQPAAEPTCSSSVHRQASSAAVSSAFCGTAGRQSSRGSSSDLGGMTCGPADLRMCAALCSGQLRQVPLVFSLSAGAACPSCTKGSNRRERPAPLICMPMLIDTSSCSCSRVQTASCIFAANIDTAGHPNPQLFNI